MRHTVLQSADRLMSRCTSLAALLASAAELGCRCRLQYSDPGLRLDSLALTCGPHALITADCLACRMLQPAAYVYRGICEMFEMYLLETFNTFSDVSIADLVHEAAPQVSGRLPHVSNRQTSVSGPKTWRTVCLCIGAAPSELRPPDLPWGWPHPGIMASPTMLLCCLC